MSRTDEKAHDEFKDIKEITMSDIKKLFTNNFKKVLIYSLVAFVSFFLFFLFFVTPDYVVDSTIEINNFQDSISLNPMSLMLGTQATSSISSYEELLKSRSLNDRVINDLNLNIFFAKKRNSVFFYIIDVLLGNPINTGSFYIKKFPKLENQNFDLKIEPEGYSISNGKIDQSCFWNVPCIIDEHEIIFDKVGDVAKSEYSLQTRSIIDARTFLKKKFNIKSVMGTNNIILQFSHENSYTGYLILKKYIEIFEDINKKWDEEEIAAKKYYINDVLSSVKKEIENKAQKLIVSQKENKIFLPSVQFDAVIKKIEFIKTELEKLELKEKLLSSAIKEMDNDKMEPAAFSVLSDNLSMLEMIRAHNELIIKRDLMKEKVTDEYPEYISINNAIKESSKNISYTLNKERIAVNNAKMIVQKSIDKIVNEQKDFPQSVLESEALKKDLELTEKLYVALTTKLYESTLDKKTGVAPLKIIDSPDPVVLKNSPKLLLSLVMMVFLSLFCSFVAVLLFEVFRERVRCKDDINKLFDGYLLYEIIKQDHDSIFKIQSFFDMISSDFNTVCYIPTAPDLTGVDLYLDESAFLLSFSFNEGISFRDLDKLVGSDVFLNKRKIVVRINDFEINAVFSAKKFHDIIVKLNVNFRNIVIEVPFLSKIIRYAELINLSDKIFLYVKEGETSLNLLNDFYEFIKLSGNRKNNMDIFFLYSKEKNS
ncbi:MAG TPA: hypothetical protein PLD55_00095 [bacterium]|jgi:uncharacterized protein involved in exopolysaccharide biosynthesis|nr:hypothetical protein [bacterium]HOG42628.1 hypothetical protein [bacterium]HQB08944.1 hypothetical protein [bacterium]HQM83058.1 hypothetical protein [bacterium]